MGRSKTWYDLGNAGVLLSILIAFSVASSGAHRIPVVFRVCALSSAAFFVVALALDARAALDRSRHRTPDTDRDLTP